ncbi:UNVERIFIED_CONTAM: hypothetical protein HHA_219690 [Hammondia hammondi]|eukprot:XP_008889440.1 hypothetical protein HHA_219690 [Hammondia hammondi]
MLFDGGFEVHGSCPLGTYSETLSCLQSLIFLGANTLQRSLWRVFVLISFDAEMANTNDLAGLEKALNKNDKIDLARTDTFVERAEELMNKQLPEKHEHNTETEKMVAFDRRNSSSMLDASK